MHVKKKKRWALLLGVLGITGYGAYKAYNTPSLVKKRRRLMKLFGAFFSIRETVFDSSETIRILSKDVREFLPTDCNEIPRSLKQFSKLMRSDEFSKPLNSITKALTMGIIQGCYSCENFTKYGKYSEIDHDFAGKIIEKLFTEAGSGFASVVVGSFARNFAVAFLRNKNADYLSKFIEIACDDRCRELIGNCVQLFVSMAVTIYLDRTMKVDTYAEIFSGLTNPEHEAQVKDIFVSVCNNAVETLIRTSHDTWAKDSSAVMVLSPDSSKIGYGDSYNRCEDLRGCASKVYSTLAKPTFEAVKSFLGVLLLKVLENTKRRVEVIQREMVEKGVEAVRSTSCKSSTVTTQCLTLCLNILNSPWLLAPS